MWPQHFACSCAGFAIVDVNGETIAAGPVHHWALSSYTAEFWAVLVAFCTSSNPVCIFSDCQTLVQHISFMTERMKIVPFWPHVAWWEFLLTVWIERSQQSPAALQCTWITSHVLEHIPECMLQDDMARVHKTTAQKKHARRITLPKQQHCRMLQSTRKYTRLCARQCWNAKNG